MSSISKFLDAFVLLTKYNKVRCNELTKKQFHKIKQNEFWNIIHMDGRMASYWFFLHKKEEFQFPIE